MTDDALTPQVLSQGWVNLLRELALAREYPAVYEVAGSAVGKNPVLETLLPSQFYIRLASLADEALALGLDERSLTCTHPNAKGKPKHEKPTFANRISCLHAHGILPASTAAAFHSLRRRRNELAHSAEPEAASWPELDAAVVDVEQCLLDLQFVAQKLRYVAEPFQEKVQRSSDPTVACQQDYGLMLKHDGQPIGGTRWTVRWSK